METKGTCADCKEEKDPNEFYIDRKRKNGLHTYCKNCCKKRAKAKYAANPEDSKQRHKEWVENNKEKVKFHKIKSAYGLTKEEWDALPKICTICGSIQKLRLDHSHHTGRVRGILCDGCNKGLGFFKDDPTLLLRASDYIFGVAKPDIFEATYEEVEALNESVG